MSKHDDTQQHSSQNEIHVETHTKSHVSSGGINMEGDAGAAMQAAAQATSDQQIRIDELTADLQRLQAEFINYRRRAEAEKAEVIDFAKARVVREFLTVRDSFSQEQAHRPKDADPDWAKSIDAIRTQFDQVLKALSVEQFVSKGQAFDPHLHEAIAMEDGEGEYEVVAEELQPGYKLGDAILRHAIVKVGRTKAVTSDPQSAETGAHDAKINTAE